MNEEGVIIAELDEVLDPRPSGKKPGVVYHFLSIKKPGQGTAELYVSKEIWEKVRALALAPGSPFALIYRLNKWQGQFEPRLADVARI